MAQNLYKFTANDYEMFSEQIVEAILNGEETTELTCEGDFLVDFEINVEEEDSHTEYLNEFMGSYETREVGEYLIKSVKFAGAYTENGEEVMTGAFDYSKLQLEYKDWDGEIRVGHRALTA